MYTFILVMVAAVLGAANLSAAGGVKGGGGGKSAGGGVEEEERLRPIASRSEARRICAELCLGGLGGPPCGEECLDLAPQKLPLAASNGSRSAAALARLSACPLLCQNNLGQPLCACQENTQAFQSVGVGHGQVDFVGLCAFFCLQFDHRIEGCQKCEIFKKSNGVENLFKMVRARRVRDNIDWEAWCKEKCVVGDGGVACNCDILPFSAPVKLSAPPLQMHKNDDKDDDAKQHKQ